MHTHVQTHMPAQICTQDAHTNTNTHTPMCTYIQNIHMHTCIVTHIHVHTCTATQAPVCTQGRMCTPIHPSMCNAHTHYHTYISVHTHHMPTDILAYMCTCVQTHRCACAHTLWGPSPNTVSHGAVSESPPCATRSLPRGLPASPFPPVPRLSSG